MHAPARARRRSSWWRCCRSWPRCSRRSGSSRWSAERVVGGRRAPPARPRAPRRSALDARAAARALLPASARARAAGRARRTGGEVSRHGPRCPRPFGPRALAPCPPSALRAAAMRRLRADGGPVRRRGRRPAPAAARRAASASYSLLSAGAAEQAAPAEPPRRAPSRCCRAATPARPPGARSPAGRRGARPAIAVAGRRVTVRVTPRGPLGARLRADGQRDRRSGTRPARLGGRSSMPARLAGRPSNPASLGSRSAGGRRERRCSSGRLPPSSRRRRCRCPRTPPARPASHLARSSSAPRATRSPSPLRSPAACARRERPGGAVLVTWPATEAPRPALGTPAASRVVAGLRARGLDAVARGRLAWLALGHDDLALARRALAAVDVPVVVAITGPRSTATDELLADQDQVVLVVPAGGGRRTSSSSHATGSRNTTFRSRSAVRSRRPEPEPPRWPAGAG